MHNLYDLIGIGIGPFNMSLAALLEKTSGQKSLFLEKTPHFVWHPGMLMKNSKLQVHYLKDLVTLADPTNPYSFLMFLSEHKRLYKFLNQKTSVISRLEFNHYLQWVSKKLSNLKFGIDVSSVSFEKDSFFIKTNCGVYQSHHLVLGTGRAPHIPDCLKFLKSETLFHSSEYLQKTKPLKGKSVAIIGGGQSGAEILHDILNKENDLPAEILIASKRLNFQPMDDSCFTNEFFTPSYAKLFYHLDEKTRHELLKQQLLASDGISQDLADEIYRRIYELKYILNSPISINFFFNHRLTHARPYHEKYRLQFQNRNDGKSQYFDADHVILCTGYRYKIPKFLEPILNKIEFMKENKPGFWEVRGYHIRGDIYKEERYS